MPLSPVLILFRFLPLFLPPAVIPLQCFQTQHSLSASLQGNALSCPSSSLSCTKSTDFNMQIIARTCQNTNCTFPNGTLSSVPLCFNSSSNTQSYCCCYGDSCNGMAKEHKNGLMTFLLLFFCILMGAMAMKNKI
ncbi:hypothetical protein niasHS_013309 [Heterodera schachtii]|uniref:Uncharacterized protein n=1 Tax=Heterodera schachtii TaxID=97005 RepID=A0ABD2IID4_HETSC